MALSPSRKIFTENMTALMGKRSLSDAALAETLGVHRITVWRWRKGKQEPREYRDAIAKALKVKVSTLFMED